MGGPMTHAQQTLDETLQKLVAESRPTLGPPARDPVNQPMIRHWCDAVRDLNPVYTDPVAAAASTHGGIVAPPTMLQAWSMRGLEPRSPAAARQGAGPTALLHEAGYTSVVATDCEQDYKRYLRPGDLLTTESQLESISSEKRTALGDGYFVTTRITYRDQADETVAEMRFRILWFKPPQRAES
jgi:acyl dehydratase